MIHIASHQSDKTFPGQDDKYPRNQAHTGCSDQDDKELNVASRALHMPTECTHDIIKPIKDLVSKNINVSDDHLVCLFVNLIT